MAQDATTATQLATLLGVTPVAVRRHLDLLESDGLIEPRQPRGQETAGRGRPAKSYRITDAGRDRFHHAYSELAAQAIAQILSAAGTDGLDALAEAHFSPIEHAFGAALETNPSENPADALVEALDAGGYAAQLSQLNRGVQLCQHHCPVADVARLYPELCEIETGLIAKMLGSHVQRLATIAHGDGVCTINIPKGAMA